MNRRELVVTGAATLGAAAFTAVATGAAAATGDAWTAVAASTSKCIAVGLDCAQHCRDMMAKGNKDMAICHAAVTDMLASCEALQKLASAKSPHAAAMAKVCADVCADCAKACGTHGAHMAACKKCEAACDDCIKSCKAAAA